MKRHLDSAFQFTYLAPETGYEREVQFHSGHSPHGHTSTRLSDDEYMVFCVSRKDDKSGETRRYYGIITRIGGFVNLKGELEFSLWYYLNPDPEDRNIEYGP